MCPFIHLATDFEFDPDMPLMFLVGKLRQIGYMAN